MNRNCKFALGLVVIVVVAMASATDIDAAGRGGARGGGARPSMGSIGGGGGRPSMGGGGGARPPMSRPSPAGNRPSMANVSRPNVPNRPAGGNFSPSGGRPSNINRPGTKPGGSGIANRPSISKPENLRPTNRPASPGGGNRPDLGNRPTTLPGTLGRPSLGGDRPGLGNINRPTTLPGSLDRPGIGADRPSLGNINRPTTLPGTIGQPGIGVGNRPGGGLGKPERPGSGDRPIIGGGNNRPGRPGIGNGNINIGNDINIGSGNNNIIGNRPHWDRPNWNNPGWGWGGGGWAANWHDHCIHPHHGWYNGCWNNYWGSHWYAPVAWISVGWGLNALTNGWGYGSGYYNPYYAQSADVASYDYSQPIVINNYVSNDTEAQAVTTESGDSQHALQRFDDGLAQFKSGDYRQALGNFDAALKMLPKDPAIHEVRALTLFALGDYGLAAAALNSVLSSAPGMDWTTMSSLYGNGEDYTAQLRKLEQHCKSKANDSAAAFVLAYHYLVLGSKDAAINALKAVVKNQPKDVTAKRMLDALAPPAPPSTPPTTTLTGSEAAETDLVGTWQAKLATTTIELSVTEDSKFVWKATQAGKPPLELHGQLASAGDAIELESDEQGSMAGSVKALGPDKWQFILSGAPPADPGLTFERVAK